MRIGLFGGSFDPPHLGHLAVAEAARSSFQLDRVLLTPVAVQPLKMRGAFAGYADRLRMVGLVCGEGKGLVASGLDAPRAGGKPNFTVDTLTKLRESQPGAALFSLIGLDAFSSFPQWHEPDELLRLAEWIVVSRPGYTFDRLQELNFSATQWGRVHRLTSVENPVSATAVRARLGKGESCVGMVPEPVLAYIREHQLYRGE